MEGCPYWSRGAYINKLALKGEHLSDLNWAFIGKRTLKEITSILKPLMK